MNVLFILMALLLLGVISVMALFGTLTRALRQPKDEEIPVSDPDLSENAGHTNYYLYFAFGLALILFLSVSYFFYLKDSPAESHFFEWMNLIVRWMHITFGIAWIGASFYFVFLENSLNRTKGLRDDIAGNLWAIHGGGFYYLEKYKNAPEKIPNELHWFKYEAYFTWLSGFVLLCIVYYFNAKSYLIDPAIWDISPAIGVGIGMISLIGGWVIYDRLCKSALGRSNLVFAIIGFAISVGFAWFYTQVFNPRAAYIHMGALIGTLMAANVFFVIIPAQKEMVRSAKAGKMPDPQLGKNAGLRSLHNNYFTLPVLFIMVSNHFPSTFGNEFNWLVLAAISLGSALVKHYLNLAEKGEYSAWVLPAGVIMILAVAVLTAPPLKAEVCEDEIGFELIFPIIQNRCISCHSSSPTDEEWTSPPNGVKYDTPEEFVKMTDGIMQRVVLTNNMPQNNKTGMTPEERELIRCWILQGSKLK